MNNVRTWFKEMDGLLRGDTTRAVLAERGTSPLHLGACVGASIVLGAAYGVFMGLFAVLTRTPACWPQLIATALKVPALFLLTLGVTFPSLYVFSALLGTRLRFIDVLRVLVGAIAVNLCVLAAFSPITGFFTISTTSYAFMKLLNVAFFAISGVLGLGFLVRVLRLLEESGFASRRGDRESFPLTPPPGTLSPAPSGAEGGGEGARLMGSGDSGPPAPLTSPPPMPGLPLPPVIGEPTPVRPGQAGASNVLAVWLILYGLVGAQMGWVLRPFIGNPEQAFTLFRAREANIFLDLLRSLGEFFR